MELFEPKTTKSRLKIEIGEEWFILNIKPQTFSGKIAGIGSTSKAMKKGDIAENYMRSTKDEAIASIVGWENVKKNGNDLPCNRENVAILIDTVGHYILDGKMVATHIVDFAGNPSNFGANESRFLLLSTDGLSCIPNGASDTDSGENSAS